MTPGEQLLSLKFKQEQAKITAKYEKAAARREAEYEVLLRLLPEIGTFYRTTEGRLLFFRDGDHRLYDLEEKAFERYLTQLTGEVNLVRHQWLPKLQALVQFEAREVETHFLAYNDSADLGLIAINTFDGFMLRRRRGSTWDRVANGTDGILFLTPEEFLTPWQAEGEGAGGDLAWLLGLGHFAADGPLSVADQRGLLQTWILHLFLPALSPVHPIPLHEGVTGSGKSVLGELLGRWLTGPQFEVMDLPSGDAARAEESLKLALSKRPLVVIDNVDSPARWLEDFLCRVATGVRMSCRRLYTNAEEVYFTPKAGLIVTSRDPHFRREDVARRLVPLRFQAIPEDWRRTETELRAEVDTRRGRIWADVLALLARLQDAWLALRGQLKSSHSLADFSVLGEALTRGTGGDPAAWRGLMDRLAQAQGGFVTEEDPLAELLEEALDRLKGTLKAEPVRELYKRLQEIAEDQEIPWPFKIVAALTKALKNQRQALEQRLGARIVLTRNHHGGEYWVNIQRCPRPEALAAGQRGGVGGNGGDGEAPFLVELSAARNSEKK